MGPRARRGEARRRAGRPAARNRDQRSRRDLADSRGGTRRPLRARATLAFGGITLCLAVLTGAGVWVAVSQYLLGQRETSSAAQTAAHAEALQRRLQAAGVPTEDVLAQVRRPTSAGSVLLHRGQWYASSLGLDRGDLPRELVDTVAGGSPARQRVEIDGSVRLVVGVPVADGAYFEVFPLDDLNQATDALAVALVGAALAAPPPPGSSRRSSRSSSPLA